MSVYEPGDLLKDLAALIVAASTRSLPALETLDSRLSGSTRAASL